MGIPAQFLRLRASQVLMRKCFKQSLKNAHLILSSLVALFQWAKCNVVAGLLFVLVITIGQFRSEKELIASNQLVKKLLLPPFSSVITFIIIRYNERCWACCCYDVTCSWSKYPAAREDGNLVLNCAPLTPKNIKI